MELALLIYVVQVVFPLVSVLFGTACAALAFFMVVSTAAHFIWKTERDIDEDGDIALWVKKKRLWIGVFALAFISNIVPDKETSYSMVAAYGVQSVARDEKVQEFAGNSFKVLDKYMKEYLEEGEESEPVETSTSK